MNFFRECDRLFIKEKKALKKEAKHMEIIVGDIIKLKKQHPCGSQEWEVLRVGMDFRLKCMGCGHQVMLPRKQVEKSLRGIRDRKAMG